MCIPLPEYRQFANTLAHLTKRMYFFTDIFVRLVNPAPLFNMRMAMGGLELVTS
jgi:hypothetical protein